MGPFDTIEQALKVAELVEETLRKFLEQTGGKTELLVFSLSALYYKFICNLRYGTISYIDSGKKITDVLLDSQEVLTKINKLLMTMLGMNFEQLDVLISTSPSTVEARNKLFAENPELCAAYKQFEEYKNNIH